MKLAFTQVAKERLLRGTVFSTDDRGYYVQWDALRLNGKQCEFMDNGAVIATLPIPSMPRGDDTFQVNGLDGRLRVDISL